MFNTKTNLLLLKAAEYMEKHGHCKKTPVDDNGQVCMLGAIGKVYQGDNEGYWLAIDTVAHYLGIDPIEVITWNDYMETTPEKAIAALRGAASMHEQFLIEDDS